MREMESELTTFPYGRHDDLIDALAWQVGDRTATEYEHKEAETSRVIPKMKNRIFTLDEIRESCRAKGRGRMVYPFQRQNEVIYQ
jgi:hypothetical protein